MESVFYRCEQHENMSDRVSQSTLSPRLLSGAHLSAAGVVWSFLRLAELSSATQPSTAQAQAMAALAAVLATIQSPVSQSAVSSVHGV